MRVYFVTFYLQFDDVLKKLFCSSCGHIFLNMTLNCHKSKIESVHVQFNWTVFSNLFKDFLC